MLPYPAIPIVFPISSSGMNMAWRSSLGGHVLPCFHASIVGNLWNQASIIIHTYSAAFTACTPLVVVKYPMSKDKGLLRRLPHVGCFPAGECCRVDGRRGSDYAVLFLPSPSEPDLLVS